MFHDLGVDSDERFALACFSGAFLDECLFFDSLPRMPPRSCLAQFLARFPAFEERLDISCLLDPVARFCMIRACLALSLLECVSAFGADEFQALELLL